MTVEIQNTYRVTFYFVVLFISHVYTYLDDQILISFLPLSTGFVIKYSEHRLLGAKYIKEEIHFQVKYNLEQMVGTLLSNK